MDAYLDSLTRAATAFRTWVELYRAMEGGYAPTLYGRNRRERMLRRVIRIAGFNVYPYNVG